MQIKNCSLYKPRLNQNVLLVNFFLKCVMEYSRVGKRKERKKLSVAKFAGIDGVNYLVGDRGIPPLPP